MARFMGEATARVRDGVGRGTIGGLAGGGRGTPTLPGARQHPEEDRRPDGRGGVYIYQTEFETAAKYSTQFLFRYIILNIV